MAFTVVLDTCVIYPAHLRWSPGLCDAICRIAAAADVTISATLLADARERIHDLGTEWPRNALDDAREEADER